MWVITTAVVTEQTLVEWWALRKAEKTAAHSVATLDYQMDAMMVVCSVIKLAADLVAIMVEQKAAN